MFTVKECMRARTGNGKSIKQSRLTVKNIEEHGMKSWTKDNISYKIMVL